MPADKVLVFRQKRLDKNSIAVVLKTAVDKQK
jgi:hypothetical protein